MCVLVGGNAREDAGAAAAQRGRRIARSFQALPDRFEHQALLRLDPHRLTRRDAEELGIESVDSVEESAEARVGLSRRLRIRVVELVDVEAVLRDFPDRIDTAGQQLPEGLRIGCAGEAARHRDDRDRLVRVRRPYRRLRVGLGLLAQPEHVAEQIVGRIGQPRVIHHEGHRDLVAHALLEAAPQLDGHERIHAQVEESGILANLRGVHAGHVGHGVAQVRGQELLALLHGRIGESLDQFGLPRCRHDRRCSRRLGNLALQLREESAAAGLLVERQETGPVDAGYDTLRTRRRNHIGQARKRIGRRKSPDPALFEAPAGFGVGHARRPRAEVDADAGHALFP